MLRCGLLVTGWSGLLLGTVSLRLLLLLSLGAVTCTGLLSLTVTAARCGNLDGHVLGLLLLLLLLLVTTLSWSGLVLLVGGCWLVGLLLLLLWCWVAYLSGAVAAGTR